MDSTTIEVAETLAGKTSRYMFAARKILLSNPKSDPARVAGEEKLDAETLQRSVSYLGESGDLGRSATAAMPSNFSSARTSADASGCSKRTGMAPSPRGSIEAAGGFGEREGLVAGGRGNDQ
ncbi:MAG: hypothetical protein ACR2I2_07690 [Bryobacteraceae bacterium]